MDKCAVLDAADQGTSVSQVRTGKVLINLDKRVVSIDDQPVHLTGKEYGILELLGLRKGTILTKEMLLDHLYGGVDEPELKIIDVLVCKYARNLPRRPVETITSRRYGVAATSFGICPINLLRTVLAAKSGRQKRSNRARHPRFERRGRVSRIRLDMTKAKPIAFL
jgi:Transcriptional regulatory protein, C terminal